VVMQDEVDEGRAHCFEVIGGDMGVEGEEICCCWEARCLLGLLVG
jgi:hypothetical protein